MDHLVLFCFETNLIIFFFSFIVLMWGFHFYHHRHHHYHHHYCFHSWFFDDDFDSRTTINNKIMDFRDGYIWSLIGNLSIYVFCCKYITTATKNYIIIIIIIPKSVWFDVRIWLQFRPLLCFVFWWSYQITVIDNNNNNDDNRQASNENKLDMFNTLELDETK